ncbi:MAG: hypothetical protein R3247_10470 [Rhodothermales bacterium]|nr:hypothetical protein [Rhodothermales bacterium]
MNASTEMPLASPGEDAYSLSDSEVSTQGPIDLVGSWVDQRPDPQFQPVVTFRIDGVVKVKTECYLYRGEYKADEEGNLEVRPLKLKDQWCNAFAQDPIVEAVQEAYAWETARDEELLSLFTSADGVQGSVTLSDADGADSPQDSPDQDDTLGDAPQGDDPGSADDTLSDSPQEDESDEPRGN